MCVGVKNVCSFIAHVTVPAVQRDIVQDECARVVVVRVRACV